MSFIDQIKTSRDLEFSINLLDYQNKNLSELLGIAAEFIAISEYLPCRFINKTFSENRFVKSTVAANILNVKTINSRGMRLGEGVFSIKPFKVFSTKIWLTDLDTFKKMTQLGEKHHHIISLKNLNINIYHSGSLYAATHDTYTMVNSKKSPYLKLTLDLYHIQISTGIFISLINKYFNHVNKKIGLLFHKAIGKYSQALCSFIQKNLKKIFRYQFFIYLTNTISIMKSAQYQHNRPNSNLPSSRSYYGLPAYKVHNVSSKADATTEFFLSQISAIYGGKNVKTKDILKRSSMN